ncbi:MAG TPA: alpha-E domain-containing protein [Ktedonobacteraceae bacterium]|nr:alpha-E domain-containing protein [Ktedonobacteraceae bacterium]
MLSRVAESLYWLSRYLERAEHTARLIDVHLNSMLDQAGGDEQLRWQRLLRSLRTPEPVGEIDAYSVTRLLTFDEDNPASIVSCIAAARENARQVRERISSEMWEQLNRLFLRVKQASMEQIWHAEPHRFLNSVKEDIYLFQGITDATMSHSEGWHFIRVGRFLERTTATAALLDIHFSAFLSEQSAYDNEPLDSLDWVELLRSCSSFEAYCKVYTAAIRPAHIAEFMLLNPELPHSIRFSCTMMQAALQAISKATSTRRTDRAGRLAGRLRALLDYDQIEDILSANMHEYLENIQRQCALIHNGIYQTYIAYPIEIVLTSRGTPPQ